MRKEISREDAIRILKGIRADFADKGSGTTGILLEAFTNHLLALDMAINSLEIDAKYNLIHEDAKAAGPWIDVNVDDPDIGQDVLICDIDGDIFKGYLSGYDGWRRSEDFEKIKSAVAWMPLPEPYKGAE